MKLETADLVVSFDQRDPSGLAYELVIRNNGSEEIKYVEFDVEPHDYVFTPRHKVHVVAPGDSVEDGGSAGIYRERRLVILDMRNNVLLNVPFM